MPVVEEIRTVTPDGRIVIPWVIQRALGIEHGGPVRFRAENGVVTLHAVDAPRPNRRAVSAPVSAPLSAPGGVARKDIRITLQAELDALLSARERDRATKTKAAGE